MTTQTEHDGLRWPRAAAAALFACLGTGVALLAMAMMLYPGGNWMDHQARGHSFARNFFCDLLADVAVNGESNPGARFATAGMLSVFAALLPFWLLVPRLVAERPRLGAAMRTLGVASVAVLPAVPLAPSGRCGQLHAAAIFAAGVPGVVAATLASYALLSSRATRWLHGSIATTVLLVATLDGTIYGQLVASGGPVSWTLPVLQKLGAVLLITWMAVTGMAALRRTTTRMV
jgi:hypothetical protein